MAIQWFPGHMHLTRKAIAERVRQVDVVIELLDARLPGSSANPLLAELTGGKPGLKLLNKQDLADPVQTAAWLAEYNARPATRAIGMDASETAPARRLVDACRELAPGRRGLAKPLRILICGIPNVGKSTLVNTLAGGRKARTGDEAGITRLEQRIALADDVHLWDTPGMLWPRILIVESGFRLAASGAIGRNAFDEELVALELLRYAAERYAAALAARFELGALEAMRDEEILDAIGRRRGALLAGGRIDRQKSAEIVIDEFRSGRIGRMTLETPAEFARWQGEGERLEAQRQARKAARSRRKPEGERGHDETNTDSNAL